MIAADPNDAELQAWKPVSLDDVPFVHLHVHSAYSLLMGTGRLEELAARAAAQGHAALALTDTNGAYGLPAWQTCCDAAGIQALHGAEISDPRTPDHVEASASDSRQATRHRTHALLLVENQRGYTNLCRLITQRQLDPRFALVDDLPAHAEGLIVLTPDPLLLRDLADTLGPDQLYAEIIAHESPALRHALLDAARAVGRHPVGSHRVVLDEADKHGLHRLLLAIAHLGFIRQITPGARGRDGHPIDLAPREAHLMPPAEAARAFRDLPCAAGRTVEIARRLDWRFETPEKPRLPALDPRSLGLAEGASAEALADAAFGRLAALCFEGATRRYRTMRRDVLSRLERELRVIQDKGFADYFLIVHGLTRYARGRQIPAVGRGSAANSIVAYALGITSVDPLRYDLPFERFLSPARTDCPDIDLDLDWRGRDDVIAHAYEHYGEDRVAMISTHITFQARSAVREVAKTLGLSKEQIDPVARKLPWRLGGVLDERAIPPELVRGALASRSWQRILHAAARLDGLPRHLGIHVGGIVIGDGPLADSIPLQRSAKGLVVTQYDMHGVEATGLVKIDLLGNRALAVIADVIGETRDDTDVRRGDERSPQTNPDTRTGHDSAEGTPSNDIDDEILVPHPIKEGAAPLPRGAMGLDSVPEDDPHAGLLLREGRTLGCFQVESPGMRNLVVRMQAQSQDDAMIALSLIRPGPAGSGMKDAYIRRRRGEEDTPEVHPLLDALFRHTHGVMLYQEDTLRVAQAIAGFDLGQADQLRRALSKKRTPEDLPRMQAAFREGARIKGVPDPIIEHIWEDIARFSAYAYNKAHAATYSRISWQGLYLKARYPAHFMAAMIRNGGGFYAPRAYIEEARRLGCTIALPCVNQARIGPSASDKTLRIGFNQIKGLRVDTPRHLVDVRDATGPFLSPTDLVLRTQLEKNEVEKLILAGSLDVFDRPRGELLWLLTLDFERIQKARQERIHKTALFGVATWLPPPRHIPVPRHYSTRELLAMEMETLGLTATCHPSEIWQSAADDAGAIPTTDLAEHDGELVRIAGWIVTDRRVRVRARTPDGGRPQAHAQEYDVPTGRQKSGPVRRRPAGTSTSNATASRGGYMKFLMIEDVHGSCEVTLFPRVYAEVGHRLVDAGPYLITGVVRQDHGALTLDGRDVIRLAIPE